MKKILFLSLLSIAVIGGLLIGEYIINSRFLDVETLEVTKTTINNYTSADGEVKDGGKREITSDLPFTVKKLYVSEGDFVSAGQKLADISYDKIITKFNIASAEFKDIESYQNLINIANSKDEYILSPIKGTITAVNCSEGNDFNGEIPAFTITDIENSYVKINLNTEKLHELYIGQKAYIYQNNVVSEGKISKIYPITEFSNERNSNVITADITPVSGNQLICGDKVEVKIVEKPYEDIIVVPFDSIMFDDTSPYVFVNSSGFAIKKYVVIGKEFGTNAEITEGLDINDRVILSPRKLEISQGMKIMEN